MKITSNFILSWFLLLSATLSSGMDTISNPHLKELEMQFTARIRAMTSNKSDSNDKREPIQLPPLKVAQTEDNKIRTQIERQKAVREQQIETAQCYLNFKKTDRICFMPQDMLVMALTNFLHDPDIYKQVITKSIQEGANVHVLDSVNGVTLPMFVWQSYPDSIHLLVCNAAISL